MKEIYRKIKVITVSTLLVIFSFSFLNIGLVVNASSNYDEKIYSSVKSNENFDDNSVIVILDKSISERNKIYESSFFGRELVREVKDLTKSNLESTNSFEQIFELKLIEKGKDKVVNAIKKIEKIEGVKYVGPNRIYEFNKVSNDTYYQDGSLWGLDKIDVSSAWDFTTGNTDVSVGVIDSGIASHPDLNSNVVEGYDFNSKNKITNDDIVGHGTHVSGIIGAVGNNGEGVVGVNWDISIVPLQVSTYFGGVNSSACVEAINYAIDSYLTDNPIRVLNFSIGGYQEWPEIESAIREYQGIFVCAAGNDGVNTDYDYFYPAFYGSELHNDPLNNIIVVGATNKNDERAIFNYFESSNFGLKTVDVYAPGDQIISTFPESLFNENNESHIAEGYFETGGTSMAAPYVAGVAALLLSIDSTLTSQQLRTAIFQGSIEIEINVGGSTTHNVRLLNAYNATQYVLENYSNTEYTLSNYAYPISDNKTIITDFRYFNECNGFYKLNVMDQRKYEFDISADEKIKVQLYDNNFNEMTYIDLDFSNNRVHFIQNLNTGTYFLRTSYVDQYYEGIINTEIISRNTAYLSYGDNNILANTYNDINSYIYINSKGAGFFEFKLEGSKSYNNHITYPDFAIEIYDSSISTIPMEKFSLTGYENKAQSKQNENSIIVYLPRNGYFYLQINMPFDNLNKLNISINSVLSQKVNLFELDETGSDEITIFENENKRGDHIEKINLEQAGRFKVSGTYSGNLEDNILFILSKQNYDSNSNSYDLITVSNGYLNNLNPDFEYYLDLDEGTYFLGYFNKNDSKNFNVKLTRYVTQHGSEALYTDPGYLGDCGSMINIYEQEINKTERSYRSTIIVKGFTRVLYFNPVEVGPLSRTDFYWYSSNEFIARVSTHGTVLGVGSGSTKIMAVNKDNPSIVFVKEFTIINDPISLEHKLISEFDDTHNINDDVYKLGINVQNSPFPMVQYYSWEVVEQSETISSVSIDFWGNVIIEGTGEVVIRGYNYIYNVRSSVIINLIVEDEPLE